jgi:hypothetical protein
MGLIIGSVEFKSEISSGTAGVKLKPHTVVILAGASQMLMAVNLI